VAKSKPNRNREGKPASKQRVRDERKIFHAILKFGFHFPTKGKEHWTELQYNPGETNKFFFSVYYLST